MRARRTPLFAAALTLVVTAIVVFVRSLDVSSERAIQPSDSTAAVLEANGDADDASAVPVLLASPADSTDGARTSAFNAGCALEVEIESACDRAGPLTFELAARGAERGQKRVHRSRAQWRGLAAGEYELRVSGAGWRPHRESVHVSDASPRKVVVALEPTRFVRGRVVGPHGAEPIRRFTLRIETRSWTSEGQYEQLDDGVHDQQSDDGRFCVGGVREHGTELRVIASAVGFEDGETEWLPVQPTEGVSDVVIELARTVDALATVAGIVVDAQTSRPIEGVDVVLVPLDFQVGTAWLARDALQIMETRMSLELERRPEQNRARSSSDGTFSIATPHRRQGRVLAYHAEYALAVSPAIENTSAQPPLRIELARGTTLRGVVRTPSEGDSFRIDQIEIEGPGGHAFVAISSDQRFEARGRADGLHTVSVLGWQSDWRPNTFPRLLTRTRVAVAGQSVVEIEIPLGLGVTGGTIEGQIEAPDELWDDFRFVGTTRDGGTREAEQVRVIGPDGSFQLTEVTSGPHWVVAFLRTKDRSRWGLGGARVDVEEGRAHGPLVLDMRRSRVVGTLRRGGQPMKAARVEIVTSAEDQETLGAVVSLEVILTTDAEGQFVVHGLPPGTYRFRREGGARIAAVEIRDGQVDYALVIDD